MSFRYSLYGLTLQSNLPIPGLLPAQSEASMDVDVTFRRQHREIGFEQAPWYISQALDENLAPILTVWRSKDASEYRFLYCDKTEFRIDRAGTRVSATWPDGLSLENTTSYLVGQISAFVLRLRGSVCLHASAILVNNRAIAIVGDKGAGKSTTAASFVKQGYSVVSEDVTPLLDRDSSFFVQPGYPRVNLWPEAVKSLNGTPDALPEIAPPWEKRYLDLQKDGACFYMHAARLGAVYILASRSSKQPAPLIERLSTRDALISLLTFAHGRYLLEKPMRAREFDFMSRLAEVIPVRRVVPHTDLAHLDELCERILQDFRHSAAFVEGSAGAT